MIPTEVAVGGPGGTNCSPGVDSADAPLPLEEAKIIKGTAQRTSILLLICPISPLALAPNEATDFYPLEQGRGSRQFVRRFWPKLGHGSKALLISTLLFLGSHSSAPTHLASTKLGRLTAKGHGRTTKPSLEFATLSP